MSPTGRTGQTKRDPAYYFPTYLVGLEIFDVNATRRAGPCRARYKTCCIE